MLTVHYGRMQSLFILPLQRERTWRGGGSGVCHHVLQREMGHHKKGEVIQQRVLLQEGREMITFMRTEHSIDFTQIQDILLH